jgi:hypothetical protein
MWCWRRMEQKFWTGRVGNEQELHRVKERNTVHTINTRQANWICHFLGRNVFLKHVVEGKTEGKRELMGRRGRRHEQLLADLKEKGGYCELKEDVVGLILWRTCFVRGYRPVVRLPNE